MRLKTEAQMKKVRADSVKESSVEGYFVQVAKRYGCKRRKITPFYGPDGWPDQMIIWQDGRATTDWVELKRPKGGVFQPKQQQVHAELREYGCRVEVLNTRATVDKFFADRAKELGVKPVATKHRTKRAALLSAHEFLCSGA
jgi:hypothetical protein